MICLGIESTAHTIGVGVVEDEKILSNVNQQYESESGILPRDAFKHHAEKLPHVLRQSLSKAKLSMKDVDTIAYSIGPGIGQCLRVSAAAARFLAKKHEKKLVGANHAVAHVEIGKLVNNSKDPMCIYASGANTQLVAYSMGRYRVFGECLDTPLGNLLDTFARDFGIGFPGGPEVERLASRGKKYVPLPYVVKGTDLSYSGILTAAKKHGKEKLQDLCFSLQETAFSMLVEVSERALAQTMKKECLVIGGVAANKRLKEMVEIMCSERGVEPGFVSGKLACDNGAMIALTGLLMSKAGLSTPFSEKIRPKERIDMVDVTWLK